MGRGKSIIFGMTRRACSSRPFRLFEECGERPDGNLTKMQWDDAAVRALQVLMIS
jgi:hypothetical protein